MKKLPFIFLMFFMACSEEQATDNLQSQWTVAWTVGNESISGRLLLYNDHYARLLVDGQEGSLLVKNYEDLNFYWSIKGDQLTLQRIDNQVELNYKILEESYSHMKLAFAGDITVSLNRL